MTGESLTGNCRQERADRNFARARYVDQCMPVAPTQSVRSRRQWIAVSLMAIGACPAAAIAVEPAPQVEKSTPVAAAASQAAGGGRDKAKANLPTASVGIHVPAPAASHEPAKLAMPAPQPGTVGKSISVPRSASFADRVRTVSAIGPIETANAAQNTPPASGRRGTTRTVSPLRSFDGSGTFGYTYLNPIGQRPYFIGVTGPIYGDPGTGGLQPKSEASNITGAGESARSGTGQAAPANMKPSQAPAAGPAGNRKGT